MKKCSKCKKKLQSTEFYKSKLTKDGLNAWCKECCKEYHKIYCKEYFKKNKEKLLKKDKIYNENNVEKRREYRRKNKEKAKKTREEFYDRNLNYNKEYYQKNKEKAIEKQKEYCKKNRTKINKYIRHKIKTDVNFRLRCNLKTRIYDVLKGKSKSKSTMDLLGCDIEFFKAHIQSKFTKGMSWDNYGRKGWHIDHIIPCAKFDLTKKEQQEQCFHYSNLQPLWAKDNLSKGSKIITGQMKIAI